MDTLERIKLESKTFIFAAIIIFSCTILEFFITLEIITLIKTLFIFGVFSLIMRIIFNPKG